MSVFATVYGNYKMFALYSQFSVKLIYKMCYCKQYPGHTDQKTNELVDARGTKSMVFRHIYIYTKKIHKIYFVKFLSRTYKDSFIFVTFPSPFRNKTSKTFFVAHRRFGKERSWTISDGTVTATLQK